MTPEEQRIAIAEACGWNPKEEPAVIHRGEAWGFAAIKPKWWYIHQLPDYLGDLNAMREAEATMTEEQWLAYMPELHRVCGNCVQHAFHATAAQKAEAFLRTIGKRKD